ncbi:hypothetical protein WPS_19620 [Vulcanimicrobium alpinum]|uniref:Periplasmic heavy metal sensor n=1 Tax=Vulcanimicrobium alpinum TaxID=3016050 RepID=A0AAN2CA39_UNVUL|nr:hypothetical protein [Vulcanimicrobium alpinum]BDE06686.1 hypothetical protein WPS_19620 [Vulcanimicrobium alpinum]
MKLSLPVLALVFATGFPLAASAQQSSAAENGPPPEVHAQMQQARDNAKTAAFNDLSAADRAKVQAVIDAVNNGQQTDLRAAAQQIDAALTPAETTAVLAERTKMIAAIRADIAAMPNAPQGGPQGGPPPGARAHTASAGRFLLMLGVSREKMRELRHAQQPQAPTKPQ